jgi:endonuclease I
MKRIFTALLIAAIQFSALAQTTVPTSWDCSSGTPPIGWTFNDLGGTNGTNYTGSASCDGNSSLRMNFDEESLVIFFGEQPGAISYQINGNTGNTAAWEGNFLVQESVNGSNWTTIKAYTTAGAELTLGAPNCLDETYNFSNPQSRYLRFYYETKVSGSNVRLDEISIAEPIITAATIAVNASGNTVLDGGVAPPFGGNGVTYSITNEGTEETLEITGITLGGADASAFAVTAPSLPASILPGTSLDLVLSFSPNTGQASHTASVQIASNDAANQEFNFTIYGVNGTIATEPAQAVTGIQFPINTSYRTQIDFNGNAVASDALGGYVVVRSENGAVDSAPQDGMGYQRGQMIGNAKVVYSGRPSNDEVSLVPTYVQAGKTYHFAAFPYAGSGAFTNYLNTINSVSVTSPASMQDPGEYTGISSANTTLVSDLYNLINPHFVQFYSNYAATMINLFTTRDTLATVGATTFNRVVDCVYSGEKRLYNEPFDWSAYDYSREHTFPHSWMPSFNNQDTPEYSDYHNLYPAKQTNVNARRCNYPLGEVVTPMSPPQVYLDCELGRDANGNMVFEPRDVHKGRAARSLMYMAVCYSAGNELFSFNNPIGEVCLSNSITYPQDQNLIKKWHFQHPPDAFDMSRNDFLDSLQENRNPFVDQPDLACYIDFGTLTHISTPPNPCYEGSSGLVSDEQINFSVFPNPTENVSTLSFYLNAAAPYSIEVCDMNGRVIQSSKYNAVQGLNQQSINTDEFSNGTYLVRLQTGTTVRQQLLMVAK